MSSISAAPSIQVKVTLPQQLQQLVQSKADQYGLTISTYIKHLVLDDVKDIQMPIFKMSEKTQAVLDQALKEHALGKTHEINAGEIDDFLNEL